MVKEGPGDRRALNHREHWGLKQGPFWARAYHLCALFWTPLSCLYGWRSLAFLVGTHTFAGVGSPDLGLIWSLWYVWFL